MPVVLQHLIHRRLTKRYLGCFALYQHFWRPLSVNENIGAALTLPPFKAALSRQALPGIAAVLL